MARMNRITGGSDDLDEYLRAEYRAEEGAYLERRPDYAGRGSTDRNRRFWEPRVPTEYGVEESFTGAGTAFPRDEPLRRDESGFERGFSDTRTSGDVGRSRCSSTSRSTVIVRFLKWSMRDRIEPGVTCFGS